MSELDTLIPRPDLPAEKLLAEWHAAKAKDPKLSMHNHACMIGIPEDIYRARIAFAEGETAKLRRFDWGKPLDLEGDFVVIGDNHSPFTDWEFTSRVGLVGKKNLSTPRNLFIAGDWHDNAHWSPFPHLSISEVPNEFEIRKAVRYFIRDMLNVFDTIYTIQGNHDRRAQKNSAGAQDGKDLINMYMAYKPNLDDFKFTESEKERVIVSNFSYGFITSSGMKYVVTHQKEYSINQLTVAEKMATQYLCNAITFHQHHLGKGYDRYKNFILVDGGCLAGELAYKALDASAKAQFAQGFVLIKQGVAEPLGRAPFTDWSRWI